MIAPISLRIEPTPRSWRSSRQHPGAVHNPQPPQITTAVGTHLSVLARAYCPTNLTVPTVPLWETLTACPRGLPSSSLRIRVSTMAGVRVTLLAAVLAVLLAVAVAGPEQRSNLRASNNFGNWQTGRATFYGSDAWSIHKGSCMFGWLDKNVGTGWDIAALSDRSHDYRSSCGKCKEVKCKPINFADGYGQWLSRSNVCYNDYASVVVTITDTCACYYPNNHFSNKRWCCNDMYHMDLSVWAFEKLAPTRWGVIGISWRDVPCWYKPKTPARVPSWSRPTADNWWERPPWGWNKYMDKRIPFGQKPQAP